MQKSTNQYLKLGFLVTAGLAFFIFSIYLLGKKQNLFDSVVVIKSTFQDVNGLKQGNNVRFSGINVGTVTDITLLNDSTVVVEMSLETSVTQFIRKDSKVEIENEGLMGNKIITIYPGTANLPMVEKGDVLSSVETLATEDLLEQAKNIMQDGKLISEQLADISAKLNTGNGDFSRLLNDNTITMQLELITSHLAGITEELNKTTKKLNSGKGDLSKLIYEDVITEQIETILYELDSVVLTTDAISQNLLYTSEQINNGNGVINKLIYDTSMTNNLDSTLSKINTGLDEAKLAAETVHRSWLLNLFSKDKKNEKKE